MPRGKNCEGVGQMWIPLCHFACSEVACQDWVPLYHKGESGEEVGPIVPVGKNS